MKFARVFWIFIMAIASNYALGNAQVTDSKNNPIRIWLDLHDGGLEFSSKFVPTEGYRFKGTLSLEEWILLGRAFPELERDLLEFILNYANEAHKKGITADNIRIENACLAIGIVGQRNDISNTLLSLNNLGPQKGRLGTILPRNAVRALGMIADQSSVDFLVEIAVSRSEPETSRETAIAALKGAFLEKYSSIMDLSEKEIVARRKRLSVGWESVNSKTK